MKERVQVPLIADFPDLYLREERGHGAPGLLQHLQRLHVKASRRQVPRRHCVSHALLTAFRKEPLVAHAGDLDVQLRGPVEKSLVLRDGFGIGRLRICQYFRDMHPGAIRRASQPLNEVHTGGGIDSLVALSLDQRLAYAEKSGFVFVFCHGHLSGLRSCLFLL